MGEAGEKYQMDGMVWFFFWSGFGVDRLKSMWNCMVSASIF